MEGMTNHSHVSNLNYIFAYFLESSYDKTWTSDRLVISLEAEKLLGLLHVCKHYFLVAKISRTT